MMLADQNVETEVKLRASSAMLDRLRADKVLFGEDAVRAAMSTQYFDTADWRLHTAGLQLRLRRSGKSTVQTLKSETCVGSNAISRSEWSCPVGPSHPDLAALPVPASELAQAALGDAALGCFAHSEIDRATCQISRNDAQIEIALDAVKLVAGKHKRALHEVECELKSGSLTDLLGFVRTLPLGPELTWSITSKGEQARLLAAGEHASATKMSPIVLDPCSTLGEAFQQLARQTFYGLLQNYALVIDVHSAEAVHQARIALRQLASCLALFAPPFGGYEARSLAAETCAASRALAATRSVDVLIAALSRFADNGALPLDTRCEVAEHLVHRRASICAAANELLTSAPFQHLLIRLALRIEDETRLDQSAVGARSLVDHAHQCLHECRHDVLKHGTAVRAMTPKNRHDLRIAAKRLRDASDFFGSLFLLHSKNSSQANYLKVLGKVQSHLGDLNDLAVVGATLDLVCAGLNPIAAARIRLALDGALEEYLESEHELIVKAEKALKALNEAKPFWKFENASASKKVGA